MAGHTGSAETCANGFDWHTREAWWTGNPCTEDGVCEDPENYDPEEPEQAEEAEKAKDPEDDDTEIDSDLTPEEKKAAKAAAKAAE